MKKQKNEPNEIKKILVRIFFSLLKLYETVLEPLQSTPQCISYFIIIKDKRKTLKKTKTNFL